MKKILVCILILSFSWIAFSQNSFYKKPKYIFYFIGDGFGLAQSMAAEAYLDAVLKDTATIHLDLLKMPVLGTATTYSNSSFVTCSSASGTALATGNKTDNNKLGVSHNGTAFTSIAEILQKQNYRIGIISSVSLDNATPAAFYANVMKRDDYEEIARQLAHSHFDYFGGGGLEASIHNSFIWNELRNEGYSVLNNKSDIQNYTLEKGPLFASSSLLDVKQSIPYVIDEPKHDMHLSFFVNQAIRLFEATHDNFFMMIEGGKIDWACHDNDAPTAVFEIIELNKAFLAAYQFYLKYPDETLIIMTADHETGGLSLGSETTGYAYFPELINCQTVSYYSFQKQTKVYEEKKPSLNDIYTLYKNAFGLNANNPILALNKKDSAKINVLYNYKTADSVMKKQLLHSMDSLRLDKNFTYANLARQLYNQKTGFGWTTGSHTGIAVPVRAVGVRSELFSGYYDNTDLFRTLLQLTK